MNSNSYICRFAAERQDWKDLLDRKGITVKESGRLSILNYGIECDFSDPIVQEARGIILDAETFDVVCWPFRKFANYGEGYADCIDWNTARVQEKIDGSIVKLWFDRVEEKWRWSTNSMIDASEARTMDGSCSFLDLIRRADNYRDIPFESLEQDCTYIFELVAPEQKIIIQYDYPFLYHIGTRSNITGHEYNTKIGIKKPQEFSLHSLADCIAAAEQLNAGSGKIRQEGFVVVDANWHRIKVKSPEYVYAHRIATNRVYTKKRLVPMVRRDDDSLEELIKTAPDAEVYARYYQWQYAELKRAIRAAVSRARAMYEELGHDRKAMAGRLKEEQLQYFCFKALGNNMTVEELLSDLQDSAVARWLPDYQEQSPFGAFHSD